MRHDRLGECRSPAGGDAPKSWLGYGCFHPTVLPAANGLQKGIVGLASGCRMSSPKNMQGAGAISQIRIIR